MQFPVENNDICYDIAGAPQADGISRLIAEVFARDEPLAVTVGQTPDEFREMLGVFLPAALPDRLTICGHDGNDIVGVALATAFTFQPPEGIEATSPNYPPIGALIGALEAGYERENTARLDTCLHLHMLAVGPGARGRGVARGLVRLCGENGAARGFTHMLADATNPASRRVFDAEGFASINEVRYDGFRFKGRPIFAGLAELGGIALMEKRL